MARRTPHFDWDQLLDGTIHTVDLDQHPAFEGGLDTVRALAYRQAERRRHTVTTHKLDPTKLQIQAHDVKPPCGCGAKPGQAHPDTCPRRQTPQHQPAGSDDQLLGPCTCGQAPHCQPHCTRLTA